MLVLVVVLFALLWLPIHIHLLDFFFDELPTGRVYQAATVLFSCLAYFNSCVNPIIYNYASKEFRDAFLEVARCGRAPASASNETAVEAIDGGQVIALKDNDEEAAATAGRQHHGQTINTTTVC